MVAIYDILQHTELNLYSDQTYRAKNTLEYKKDMLKHFQSFSHVNELYIYIYIERERERERYRCISINYNVV